MFEKFISHRTPEKDRRNTNDRVVVASSLPNVHLRDPRPKFADIEAMEFWKRIFPGAMDQFKSSPPQSKPQSPEYNIRDKRDWQGIYQALENARAHYQNRGGAVGNLRFHLRKGADGIAPAVSVTRAVSEIAPGDPVLTPILGALVILMDAVKTSSVVRQQALQGLGNLTTIFADVELFLRTFPKDSHILNASLCLIITTLDTIERGIAFFMSAQVARMVKAVALGDRYGESLVNGLDLINQKCQALMREANKSTLYQVHLASQEASKVLSQLWVETKQSVHPALERIQNMIENLTGKDLPIEKGRQNSRAAEEDLLRAIETCLTTFVNEKARELKQKDDELLAAKQQIFLLQSSMNPKQHDSMGRSQLGYPSNKPLRVEIKSQSLAPRLGRRY